MARPSKYPEQFRREAVQMPLATDASSASVARRLGVNETTLRNWVKAHQAEEARAADPLSVSPSEFEELRRLRLEVKELKMEKEILREAAAYFAAGDDPVCRFRFVAELRSAYGVKRLCRVIGASRSGFYAWAARPASQRSLADAALGEKVAQVYNRSRCTYGAARVHAELERAGTPCGRKRVARLMRGAGLVGVHARRRWRRGKHGDAHSAGPREQGLQPHPS